MTLIAGLELQDLIALRSLDRDGVRARFGDLATTEGVAYEGLQGVDRMDVAAPRMHFFFSGAEQLMLYVPRRTLRDVDPAAIASELGEPEQRLRSRAGRHARISVWPQQGVAMSADADSAQILEVFQPTTLDRYKSMIYRDPGPFIR